MIRLVFSDLLDHASTWIGAFAVAVVCGYLGGWVASIEFTAGTYKALQNVGAAVLMFSLVAAVVVLTSAANLTVSAQRRSYALWQLANVMPRMISRVVLVQLVVVAVMGAVCGTLLAAATFIPLFPLLFDPLLGSNQVIPQVGFSLMPAVWLGVVGVFLCGGLKGARSAAQTPPLTVLREPEPKCVGITWLRGVLFVGVGVGIYEVVSIMLGSAPDVVMNWSLYLPILLTALLALVAPVAFSLVMRAWTTLIPQARWNAWYIARHTARYSLSSSTSVETPIMVGFGLVAGVYSAVNLWAQYAINQGSTTFTGIPWIGAILIMGGPVLLCATGAAVSVVMTSRSRTRDVALLIASGAQPQTIRAAAVCEAAIHALTATLVGTFGVITSNAIVALAVGLPLFGSLAFGEGLVVSLVGFLLVLTATCIPTYAALHREPAVVLALQA